jgi:hypothetical protein
MKYYHFARLRLAASLIRFLGMVFVFIYIGSIFFDFPTGSQFIFVPVAFFAVGITLNFSISLWLRYKMGGGVGSPHSPVGTSVDPTGIWADDETPLESGYFVLARSQGRWRRAVVVEMKSGDRALVHFLGWDSFWDEIHYRHKLQLPPEDHDNDRSNSDTSFRE